jgi:hypothetical protein
MLLSPNNRSVYTDALTPPAGFQLDTAVAATYSMDLTTLLSVPLQLVLQSSEDYQELLQDPISLYEALQRAVERVHVFVEHGRIQAPRQHHLLYSLLEPMITEVTAPKGGAFHPKVWVLRFIDSNESEVRYRLLLASKNLTADRCWDVALSLDGMLKSKTDANGPVIAGFVNKLAELAHTKFEKTTGFRTVVKELLRVSWELPEGFDTLKFHVLGMGDASWRPPESRRLVVISPFVKARALEMLAKTSEIPLAVVSRSDTLHALGGKLPFRDAYVLHDAAETEDGEDESGSHSEIGLHAKVYMAQAGQITHVAVGSANATDAALVARNNVEVLAELSGPTYKVGSVLNFLNPDQDAGIGQYLVKWDPEGADSAEAAKPEEERLLEDARQSLVGAGLSLSCRSEGDKWILELQAKELPNLAGIKTAKAWPVTVGGDRAVDVSGLSTDSKVVLPLQALESLTSLVAFRLEAGNESVSFTLNLPVSGMPDERERAILRSVVKNRQCFLRYLLLLLAGLGDGADVGAVARAFSSQRPGAGQTASDDVPLLEELVRAFARDRKRLHKVERLIADITADGEAEEILPEGFPEFWTVFREAIALND